MALTDTKVPESIRLRRRLWLDGEGDAVDPSKGSEGEILRGESDESGYASGDDSSSESDVEGIDDRRLDGNSFNVSIMLASTAALSGWWRKELTGLSRFLDFVRLRNIRYGAEPLLSVSMSIRTRNSCCGDDNVFVSVMDMTTNRSSTAL
jgi:hypothetical protein